MKGAVILILIVVSFSQVLAQGTPSTTAVANCKEFEAGTNSAKCKTCNDGFTLDDTKTVCFQCTAGCKTCDTVQKKCTACKDNLYFSPAGLCVLCSPNCEVCELDKCKKCSKGSSMINGSCVKCSSDCIECTSTTSCTTCDVAFKKVQSNGSATCELDIDGAAKAVSALLIIWIVVICSLTICICIIICCCCGLCVAAATSEDPQKQANNNYVPLQQPSAGPSGYNQGYNPGYNQGYNQYGAGGYGANAGYNQYGVGVNQQFNTGY